MVGIIIMGGAMDMVGITTVKILGMEDEVETMYHTLTVEEVVL
jgi:hypothetical protein|tara:strand:+ start:243 stop:371 length:129 start_codon:yes stop_codon:yes gene_type:complete